MNPPPSNTDRHDQALLGLCSKAPAALLADLAGDLRSAGGPEVAFESGGGVEVARRVADGVAADVLVLAEAAMADLEAAGRLAPSNLRPLFRSQVVLAVPEAAPPTSLDTEDDLRAALLGAPSIAYSTGPSGTALLALVDSWALADQLDGRLLQAPPGVPVGALIADGRAAIGIQQRSEFTGVAGVRVVGPLPGSAAVTSTFSGAVLAASKRPDEAGAALDYFASPAAAARIEAHGLRPAAD